MIRFSILLLLCVALLSPAPAQDAAKPERVQVVLNWFAEAEHGGYYAALVNGYYKEEGLDVEIIPGGVDVQVLPMVATGRTTFGIDNADQVLLARANEAPLIAVAAPIQTSPRCIIVHEASGFKKLEDLKDMTLAISPRAVFTDWVRKKYPLEGVKTVPYPGNVSQFVIDEDYACQGYNISEPFVARSKGAKPYVIMGSDTGYNPYTSMIVTNEKTVAENPEMVRKFVRASMKGWASYMENPEPANKFINRVNPEMGMDILAFGAAELKTMVSTPDTEKAGIGSMSAERWNTLAKQLEEIEAVKKGVLKAENAWTDKFLTTK